MELKIKLNKEIGGYWDGGLKNEFTWFIDGEIKKDKRGKYVKIGSWEANYWFNVAVGKTEKLTLSNALRSISSKLKKRGLKFSYQYV
jgi:hypothetical protein